MSTSAGGGSSGGGGPTHHSTSRTTPVTPILPRLTSPPHTHHLAASDALRRLEQHRSANFGEDKSPIASHSISSGNSPILPSRFLATIPATAVSGSPSADRPVFGQPALAPPAPSDPTAATMVARVRELLNWPPDRVQAVPPFHVPNPEAFLRKNFNIDVRDPQTLQSPLPSSLMNSFKLSTGALVPRTETQYRFSKTSAAQPPQPLVAPPIPKHAAPPQPKQRRPRKPENDENTSSEHEEEYDEPQSKSKKAENEASDMDGYSDISVGADPGDGAATTRQNDDDYVHAYEEDLKNQDEEEEDYEEELSSGSSESIEIPEDDDDFVERASRKRSRNDRNEKLNAKLRNAYYKPLTAPSPRMRGQLGQYGLKPKTRDSTRSKAPATATTTANTTASATASSYERPKKQTNQTLRTESSTSSLDHFTNAFGSIPQLELGGTSQQYVQRFFGALLSRAAAASPSPTVS